MNVYKQHTALANWLAGHRVPYAGSVPIGLTSCMKNTPGQALAEMKEDRRALLSASPIPRTGSIEGHLPSVTQPVHLGTANDQMNPSLLRSRRRHRAR